jgi:hypothetical protein
VPALDLRPRNYFSPSDLLLRLQDFSTEFVVGLKFDTYIGQ